MECKETLCYLVEGQRVWLAEGQRGIVRGKRTGYGGKLHRVGSLYEPIPLAARREPLEEAGVFPVQLEHRGVITFFRKKDVHEVHLRVSRNFLGTPRASEEMRDPALFFIKSLPYDCMFSNDKLFVQRVLEGESVCGSMFLRGDFSVESHDLTFSYR